MSLEQIERPHIHKGSWQITDLPLLVSPDAPSSIVDPVAGQVPLYLHWQKLFNSIQEAHQTKNPFFPTHT